MNSYLCEFCDKSFKRKYHLKRHVENVHHGIIEKESFVEYVFNTKQDFMEWKSKMELETLSSYFSERYVIYSGTKYHYYECSRSGTYEPVGEKKRIMKSQGTSKIGRRCPSRLVVHEREKVFVKFFNKHEGHGIDLEHLRLPRTSRESVAGKLKEGVEMKRIIDDIREEAVSTKIVNRSSLISRKDLHNIKDSCKISNQRHACAMRSGHNPINSRGDDFKKKEVSRLIEQLPVFSNESENGENKNRELINLAHQLIENLSTRNYDEQGVSKIEKTLRKCVFESQELALESRSTSVEPNLKRKVDKQLPLFSTKKKNTKTSCLKNPTHKEVDSIREGLLNGRKVMNIHTDFDHTYLRIN